MKKFIFIAIISTIISALLFLGCDSGKKTEPSANPAAVQQEKEKPGAEKKEKVSEKRDEKSNRKENKSDNQSAVYTMRDVKSLKDTKNFAKGALDHIFNGSINKQGKATGFHYSKIEDSKGKIISGTRSRTDKNGVFTAKVRVADVNKNGFSSFYPESWSPQEVVDSINRAYKDALSDPANPHGTLWIGHDGNLEIDMYLNESKKIVTAYPIFTEKKK